MSPARARKTGAKAAKKGVRAASKPASEKEARSAAARPSGERPRPGRFLAALVLALLVGLGAFKAAQSKVAQHLLLQPLAPVVLQGSTPGTLSGVTALKADGRGGVVSLCEVGDLWRVQHFGPGLALLDHADFTLKEMGQLSDLAVLPDGEVRLAGLDGSLYSLDPRLRRARRGFKAATGLNELHSLDRLPDGRLAALDVLTGSLDMLDGQGKVLAEVPVQNAALVVNVAVVPEGLALLEGDGQGYWVRVLDPGGKPLRHFKVEELPPAAAVRMAASAGVLAFNDSGGSRGLVFYTVSGRPLGNSVCLGPNEFAIGEPNLEHPGFVGGDPAGGLLYIHYSIGLLKVRLPWPAKGPE
ncbi:MAG TPA: hypothetical protein VK914_01350 [bacterium]|nr:hypothetical protein [bacterium]